MKKIFIPLFLLFLLIYSSQNKVSASPGQCCNQNSDCNVGAGETCSGDNPDCSFAGYLGACAGGTTCLDDGKLCTQGAKPDPCCNGCQYSGDPYPYDYTCGGVRNSNYNPTPKSSASPLDLNQIQTKAFPGNTIPSDIGSMIGIILPYIFGAAGIALLIYLIVGGLQMMTSRGDPKAMQSAQAKITNAVIGFIIVIFAFVIVRLFGDLFGLRLTLFSQIFGGN